MAIPTNEPNLFDLDGVGSKNKDVHITYSTSSIAGKPIFNYKDSNGAHNFIGSQIRTQETEIDTMVTVTLVVVPDLHTITLTLIVPDINLQNCPVQFETIAILTTHKNPIGGPCLVKGALQSYEIIELQGTADSVVF
jgi:hypothetical protein